MLVYDLREQYIEKISSEVDTQRPGIVTWLCFGQDYPQGAAFAGILPPTKLTLIAE